jgi:uncharacterized protein
MFRASPAFLAKLEAGSKSASTLPPEQRAFLAAAKNGDANLVRESLAKGVPVDVREDFPTYMLAEEQTALMYAAWSGHLEIVRLLLKAGANVSAFDKGNASTDEGMCTALHYAVKGGNPAVIEELLNAGADVNALTTLRNTPVNHAVRNNHIEVIRLLIKRGANLGSKIGKKKAISPLYVAVYASQDKMPAGTMRDLILLLLEAGADPNGTGDREISLLGALAGTTTMPNEVSIPLIEALLKAGAKADPLDKDGHTPLTGAAYRNNPAAVRLLVEAGADVNRVFLHRGSTMERTALDMSAIAVSVRNPGEDVVKRAQEVSEILRAAGGKKRSEMP